MLENPRQLLLACVLRDVQGRGGCAIEVPIAQVVEVIDDQRKIQWKESLPSPEVTELE
jgi:hypothetical protein